MKYRLGIGVLAAFIFLLSACNKNALGGAAEPLKLPQVDAGLAETVVVTRNGWERDILPSASDEVKEYIDKELASCKPIKAYKSWNEVFSDGEVYGSPNTVTLLFPNDSSVVIQCYLIDKSYVNLIDQTGLTVENYLYLVDDDWLSNFIETVTAMVEQTPDERYIGNTPLPADKYEFYVMTDDNAPIGCEIGSDRDRHMDTLEMLAELEKLQGFIFPANSDVTLRLFFSHEPEDVYIRYISEGHWQEQYPYQNHRFNVPDKQGIYNIFVDIRWDSENSETAFFSVTVRDGDVSRQIQEIPSLTVNVEGESVLLVDMSDPLVRNFFSGCEGYDVASLDINVESMETRQKTPGHIDPRYTYPIYSLDTDGHDDTYYIKLAEKLLSGEKMAGHIVQGMLSSPQWQGILFDDASFPISIAIWGDDMQGNTAPVIDEMNRYEESERIDAFVRYFGGYILIMTDEIRGELNKRGFDLSKTTVKAGWFGYPGFFFADGNNELIRVTGDTKMGYYTAGAYITPQEFAKDAIKFAADEKERRASEPPLAPGENPPTG